ncbi:MAG: hypothetical protein SP1CHLAM54_06900 [Chlamydiia bacterium]|nr:hypothetical protein [Chlamydiia bacterium]MCH9615596.1 hypothetical protein [Chlamydiia bacterium]MCH9629001.1 hypothetical protein [Chlamydiia bacterium]
MMITIALITNRPLHPETLESIKSFDDIVVISNGTDTFIPHLPQMRVIEHTFTGFGPLRNLAATHAKHDWILALDADEVLSPALLDELKTLTLKPKTIYAMPFKNYFNNRWIKGCGWYPDRHPRLYNKKETAFTNTKVHEGLIEDSLTRHNLTSPIIHYSYETLSDFLKKMEIYSDLFATEHQGSKKSSFTKALIHGGFAFFKSYILKRGFLDGREGYIISVYQGQTAYYKYLKLLEANRTCSSF